MGAIKKIIIFSGCIVSIIIVTIQPFVLSAQEQNKVSPNGNHTGSSSDLKKIENIATKVTVKIYQNSPNNPPGGSGFVIKKLSYKGSDGKYKYFVVTNRHVIEALKENLQVITPDNQHHPATQQQIKFSKPTDLGLLYFYSNNVYPEAKLNTSYTFHEKERLLVFGLVRSMLFCPMVIL
jgi:S1-C subfamily serine protease